MKRTPTTTDTRTAQPTRAQTAGFARRLASMFYECLLVIAILIFGFVLPHILLAAFAQAQAPQTVIQIHMFALLLLYFVWFWLHGGQTLAMKTWKIRVVNIDGGRLRPAQAVLRYLAAWFSLALLGLGLLWAIVDRDGQFLHDRIAGTRLISEA